MYERRSDPRAALCFAVVADRMKMLRFGSLVALLVLVGTLVPVGLARTQTPPTVQGGSNLVTIQFLNVSDWHGQLDPIGTPAVGGAPALSSYWKAHRAANPNTITLTAGDDFGATPPLSGYFDEVPAVKAQRMMGINVNTFGNHNFDRGVGHLQQMIDLAGAPTALLTPTSVYSDGVPFRYVAANLANTTGVLTGVLPYQIVTVQGVKVAIIGLVNEEAPSLVKPGAFGPIVITDSIAAANNARAQAAAAGAQVFVAITHKGLRGPGEGELIDFANGVNGFDIIFGDHTDLDFISSPFINGALVTENKSKGAKYLKVDLVFDTNTNTVTSKNATSIVPLTSAVVGDPAIVAMLKPYRDALALVYDGQIATANGFFPRGNNLERLGETPVGNLVADTLNDRYDTQITIINSGGLRDSLPSSYAPRNRQLRRGATNYYAGPAFDLVVGDVYALLPFGNTVVTRNVSGGQIWRALENGVSAFPGANGKFPQISGFRFTFDATKPINTRVLSVSLDNGTAIISNTTAYSMTTNDFMNAGGDGYTMFADREGVTREVMADVVRDAIQMQGVITPTVTGRMLNVTRISNIPDQVLAENTSATTIPFTITDPRLVTDPLTTSVTLKATSFNTGLVTNTNVLFGGSGVNRTITITPTANKSGIATVLIEVIGKSKAYDTVVVIVNDAPTVTSLMTQTLFVNSLGTTIPFTLTDSDTRPADITVTATSSNTALVTNTNIIVSGTGLTRTLTIIPTAGQTGTTIITLTISDGVSTITRTFVVNVERRRIYLPIILC